MALLIIGFPATGEEWSLDVADSFSPSRTASVTQNEVERGANVTDHRNVNPLTLSFSGFVSDIPLRFEGNYDNEATGRHTEIRERLETAHENSEFLEIENGDTRGLYENMLITQLDFNWDAETGNGLMINMQLQAVRIVSPERKNLAAERLRNERLTYDGEQIAQDNNLTIAAAFLGPEIAAGVKVVKDAPTFQRFSPERAMGRLSARASDLTGPVSDALSVVGQASIGL